MKIAKQSKTQKRATQELANKFLSVLLAFSMVMQSSPISYAYATEETAEPQAIEVASEPEVTVASEPAPEPEPEPAPEPEPEPAPEAEPVEEAAPAEEPAAAEPEQAPAEEPAEAEPTPEATPADKATPADEVKVEPEADAAKAVATIKLSLSHAAVIFGNQNVSASSATIDVPEGADARMVVKAATGYKLDAVTVNGKKVAVAADGSFTLSAADAKSGTAIAVTTKATEKAPTKTTYTFEDSYVKVTATLEDAAAVPDDATLRVTPVVKDSTKFDYDAYMKALNDSVADNPYNEDNTLLYDVTFVVTKNGKTEEIEPAEGSVKVKFEFKRQQLTNDIEAERAADVEVTHLPEVAGTIEAEKLDTQASGTKTITVTTDSFSVFAFSYTVDFTYDGYTFTMPGEGSVLLSELFAVLHIDEDAADAAEVTFTNHDLLAVEATNGDWKLTSLQSFNTSETLAVKMAGGHVTYEIAVTDPTTSSDLNDFVTSASVNADKNEQGQYVVRDGTTYDISLTFTEDDNIQFPNDGSDMTYRLPEGLTAASGSSGTFDIVVTDKDGSVTITGNTYRVQGSNIIVNFNTSHPDYARLAASGDLTFNIAFDGEFHSERTEIPIKGGSSIEIVIDTTNSVSGNKSAKLDLANNKVNYTVNIQSTGVSTNVVVSDTVSDPQGVLSLDPSSISATSSTGQPVSMSGGATGNSFTYTIPQMGNGETITFTYSADIDVSKIPTVDGKTLVVGNNEVSMHSDGDPDPDTYNVNTTIDYTPRITKGNAVVAEDGKTLTWTITVNPDAKVPMAGRTITDTINPNSRNIMKYSGSGIRVTVNDASGYFVRTDNVSWDQMQRKSDYSWTYQIPEGDDQPYTYVIEYTTEVDTTDIINNVTVNNTAEHDGGNPSSGSGVVPGTTVELSKSVEMVDLANKEITWKVSFDVPSKGLNSAVVTDTYPSLWLNGRHIIEAVKNGTIAVDGTVSGETWTAEYLADRAIITFYNDGQPGLKPGSDRKVTVTLKTVIDDDWYQAGLTDDGLTRHTNNVELKANGYPVTTTATAIVREATVDKTVKPAGTRTVDGVELPVYKYEIVLSNVTSDVNEIEDTYDTSLLVPYVGNEWDAWYIFGGSIWSQDTRGGQFSHEEIANGMKFTTNADAMPHDPNSSTGFYPKYKLVYYLTVKDAQALNTIKSRAAANHGTYTLGNTAEWNDSIDPGNIDYEYTGLTKEVLTSEEDMRKKAGEDIWIDYKLNINTGAETLNGGKPMTLTDTVTNLSVDITSIHIEPATAASAIAYDMTGNTVTYNNVPDSTAITITYRAKVIFTEAASEGITKIDVSNVVEMNGYTDEVTKTAERDNSGGGVAHNYFIKLMKYEAGNMSKRLYGAKFQLLDENKNPIKYKDGNPVIYETTEANNGIITVQGDQEVYGWTLKPWTRYYLREIEAPADHMRATFDYSFMLSDNGTTDYSQYIYTPGDTMSAKNYPGTDIDVVKYWAGGYKPSEDEFVVVKLQQKIGEDGSWSDTIRREVNDAWIDTQGMTLKLTAPDWAGSFSSLPLYVPTGEDFSGDDVRVYYQIKETKINDTDADISVRSDTKDGENSSYSWHYGSQGNTFTITNAVKSGSLKLKKAVTVNGNSPTTASEKALTDGTYKFTIVAVDEDGNPLTGDAAVTKNVSIEFENGAVKAVTGDGTLGDDGYVEVKDLKAGKYRVTEATPTNGTSLVGKNDIVVTVESGKSGTDVTAKADFVNNIDTKSVGVTKQYQPVSKNQPSVTLTLYKGSSEDAATTRVDTIVLDGTVDDAPAVVSGLNGATKQEDVAWHAQFTNLPKLNAEGNEIFYVVKEDTVPTDYTVSYVNGSGTTKAYAADGGTVKNTRDTGSLLLKKEVTGTTEKDKTFTFTIAFTAPTGFELANSYSAVKISPTSGESQETVTLTQGTATVELKADETYQIDGLPVGTSWAVTEVEDLVPDGYKMTSITPNPATGTISTDISSSTIEVVNTYSASGSDHFEAKKAVANGTWPEGETATFTLAAVSGKTAAGGDIAAADVPMPASGTTVTLTAPNAAKPFGDIAWSRADVGNTYTYEISETEGFGDGWTAGGPITVTAAVSDDGEGNLSATIAYSPDTQAITNTYSACTAHLEATKAIQGADWPEGGEVTFTVTSTDTTKLPEHATVKLTAAGTADFGDIAYDKTDAGKTYTYTITETANDKFDAGWSANPKTITATVQVGADKGDGTLGDAVVTYTPEDATVTNKYTAEGKAHLEATKAIQGASWPEGGEVTFTVTSDDTTKLPEHATVKLTAAGQADFGDIAYDKTDAGKTYTYTITETANDKFGAGWSANPKTITATVKVGDDKGDGTLKDSTVTYTPADATVTNTYSAFGHANFFALKTLENADLEKGQFEFTLTEVADAEGTELAGAYTETVSNGNLGVTKQATFTQIDYTIDDLKVIDDDGNVTYPPKDLYYKIVEELPADDDPETDGIQSKGITYDEIEYIVHVVVADNGKGGLDVTYDGKNSFEGAAFTNTYGAVGKLTIKGVKAIEGRDLTEKDKFTFVLSGDGIDKPIEVTNDANGTFTFDAIAYDADDIGKTFNYTVAEAESKAGGITCDTTKYAASVSVADATRDGKLEITATVTPTSTVDGSGTDKVSITLGKDAAFVNDYAAQGSVQFAAAKTVNGEAPDKVFTFELTGAAEQTKRNVASDDVTPTETVAFDPLTFTSNDNWKDGFSYTITEAVPENATQIDGLWYDSDGYVYDVTPREIEVKFTDDKAGNLVPTVTVDGEDVTPTLTDGVYVVQVGEFANKHFEKKATLNFDKGYFDKGGSSMGFGFTMFKANADETESKLTPTEVVAGTATVTVDSGQTAKVTMSELTFNLPGTYYYVIEENEASTVATDPAKIWVKVEVEADAEGEDPSEPAVSYKICELNGAVSGDWILWTDASAPTLYNNGTAALAMRRSSLAANNTVGRVAYFVPEVRKQMENGVLNGGEFAFELRDADGKVIGKGTNDEFGNVAFKVAENDSEDLVFRYDENSVGQTFAYTITEVAGGNEWIVYNTDPVTLTVKVTQAEDGAIAVEGTYGWTVNGQAKTSKTTDDNYEVPTIINKYDTVIVHAKKTTREYDEAGSPVQGEPLVGAHYGLWMVNPNGGEDVYLGLGRNTPEPGGALESNEDGLLWYDLPLVEGVAYYFLEEEPAPEGHLVDPYRTDYFTLVKNGDGANVSFGLVYESDPNFESLTGVTPVR